MPAKNLPVPTHLIQATTPDADLMEIGGLWSDTANNLLKLCTSLSPLTFLSTGPGEILDHGSLTGLTDDDHTAYNRVIAETVLTEDVASVTFSNIPQTYRHLMLVAEASSALTSTGGSDNLFARFNSDTGSNYAVRAIYTDGSGALLTYGAVSQAFATILQIGSSDVAGLPGGGVVLIPGYRSGRQKFTTSNTGAAYASISTANGLQYVLWASHWSGTDAITSITVYAGANLKAGSVFTLYGLRVLP